MEKKQTVNINFNSAIDDMVQKNSSFDSGVLQIAYHGMNRKGIVIDKATFEKAIPTLYNCPVVTNYSREANELGDHDVELITNADGDMKLVNITHPVGVVPESANVFWKNVVEKDGKKHEYLCADALIWKRQEAYSKIKEDGVSALSMEITINESYYKDKTWFVTDFEFTALTLIGVTPCFESASLEFSNTSFEEQFHLMLNELEEAETISTSNEEEDKRPENFSMEGGEQTLENVNKEVVEEVKEEVVEVVPEAPKTMEASATEVVEEPAAEPEVTPEEAPAEEENFSLNSLVEKSLRDALHEEKTRNRWGEEVFEYIYEDFDAELMEVYAFKHESWDLYGFKYSLNGDEVIIDWESKKKKKFQVVDLVEGETINPLAEMYSLHNETTKKFEEEIAKINEAKASLEEELNTLREFKASVEKKEHEAKCDEVFSLFGDLSGVDAFNELKENHADLSIEEIENKCYALRGRNIKVEFSAEPKQVKIMVEKANAETTEEPYGGLFQKFTR